MYFKLLLTVCCTDFSIHICHTQCYINDSRARHELIKVDSISDLGVRFDFNRCFSDHLNEKNSKAYSVLGVVKRNFGNCPV